MIRIFTKVRGRAGARRPTRGYPPGPKPPEDHTGDPIAPTELPKERSGADVGIRDAGRRPTLHHTHLSWRIPGTDHMDSLSCSEAANRVPTDIGLRLTPECLEDNDSHRPTIHRLLQSPQSKAYGSSGHPRPALPTHYSSH